MFRKSVLAVALGLLSVSASAEVKPGLGFSVGVETGTISVPVDIDQSYRIEPSIAYSSTDTSTGGEFQQTNTVTQMWLGLGIYKLNNLNDQLRVSYGARFAYGETDLGYPSSSPVESKRETYAIQPTFGVEYLLSEHFVVGGEAFVSYQEREGDQESENFHTGSRLTAKFFF